MKTNLKFYDELDLILKIKFTNQEERLNMKNLIHSYLFGQIVFDRLPIELQKIYNAIMKRNKSKIKF